ncbi:hypothetical protein GO296_04879 [Ralstonia solanacearum]|nr:hypothetical protein [Ralstonia solanacearum]NKF67597.1 hypothetical protein [Ralstonia solanacearum]
MTTSRSRSARALSRSAMALSKRWVSASTVTLSPCCSLAVSWAIWLSVCASVCWMPWRADTADCAARWCAWASASSVWLRMVSESRMRPMASLTAALPCTAWASAFAACCADRARSSSACRVRASACAYSRRPVASLAWASSWTTCETACSDCRRASSARLASLDCVLATWAARSMALLARWRAWSNSPSAKAARALAWYSAIWRLRSSWAS